MGTTQTVLVVDDDDDCRSLFAELLQAEGYQVVEARDGAEAFAICTRDAPWVVVTDCAMPVMTGIELVAALAADERCAAIPVVFAAASHPPDPLTANVIARFRKPVSSRHLLAVLRACATATALRARPLNHTTPS